MMARSPSRRARTTKKKAGEEHATQGISNLTVASPASGHVQGRGRSRSLATRVVGAVAEHGASNSPIRDSDSTRESGKKSSKSSGELATGKDNDRPIQKLDDEAFKPFGSRSRASSEASSDAPASLASCKGGPNKVICGEPVKYNDKGVQCEYCDNWFHIFCQNVPKPAYNALQEFKALSWFCWECKGKMKKDIHTSCQLETVENKVDQLKKEVNDNLGRMVHCLREQERSVNDQTKLIERSIRDNVAQKATYAEMVKGTCSEVVGQVSAQLSSFPKLVANHNTTKEVQNISRVFDDFLDKDRRKHNLVVHNLPETDTASQGERSEHDVRQFQELVKEVFKLQVRPTKSFRVGRVTPGRHRLLIVTLDSIEVKQDLLQLAPQLRNSATWGNIYISPDLSRSEREVARKLREELKSRRSAGESDLVIRKGRIVSTNDRQQPTKTTNAEKQNETRGSGENSVQDSRERSSMRAVSEAGEYTGDRGPSSSNQGGENSPLSSASPPEQA